MAAACLAWTVSISSVPHGYLATHGKWARGNMLVYWSSFTEVRSVTIDHWQSYLPDVKSKRNRDKIKNKIRDNPNGKSI